MFLPKKKTKNTDTFRFAQQSFILQVGGSYQVTYLTFFFYITPQITTMFTSKSAEQIAPMLFKIIFKNIPIKN